MSSTYLVFDLETHAAEWESFDEHQKEYLLRGALTEEEVQKKKNELALAPLTASIVCLGFEVHTELGSDRQPDRSGAYIVNNSVEPGTFVVSDLPSGRKMAECTEATLIESFWKLIADHPDIHLISFNGRGFDAPFLMLRSAVNKIRPSRNLMDGTKFTYRHHTDLLDEFCFFSPSQSGATRRYNFDFITKAFGISSPKEAGVDGSKVGDLYRQRRYADISEYCLRDVRATWQLFQIYYSYLRFPKYS